MLRTLILTLFLLGLTTAAQAQDYGHMNFTNVLAEMPRMQASQAELETFNDQLVSRGEKMAEELRAEAASLEERQPTTAPVEFEKLRKALLAKRDELVKYEREVEFKLEQKRQQLLGPLINELKAAIKTVAEREGYQLVFDTSVFNAVLFAEDSKDITTTVKAELGME